MEDLTRVAHNIPSISWWKFFIRFNSNCAINLHHHLIVLNKISHFFICISGWVSQEVIKIWLICIFKMAAKMAEICLRRHIFLSQVHSLNCIGHLHIQNGRKNSRFILRIAYFAVCSPHFLLYDSQSYKFIAS